MIDYKISILIIALIIVSLAFFLYRKKKQKQNVLIEDKNIKQEEIQIWFNEQVNEFEKQCIAYGIEIESDRQEISIYVKEELREKYGKVLLEPSLLVYDSYNSKFGFDYECLEKAINSWLENNSKDIIKSDKQLKQIEKIIFTKSYDKAKSIVTECVKK